MGQHSMNIAVENASQGGIVASTVTGRAIAHLFSRAALPYWGIFLIAFAVRAADQYFISTSSPFYGSAIGWPDSTIYDQWAREISQTFWFNKDRTPFSHTPLYPYFLGILYLRFGASVAVAAWSQRIIGSLTVVLLFWLGRYIFGKRAGWITGIGAAACPLFLLYESEILAETLILFLHVLFLVAVIQASERRTPLWWCLSGITLGLCCLGRPNSLLLVPPLALWAFFITPGNVLKRAVPAALLCVCATLAITPTALLNHFVGGHFSLVTSSGSCNLYIGNSPDSNGTFMSSPLTNAIRQRENKSDLDIDWHGHLLAYMRAEPLSFMRGLWHKTLLFWQSGEVPSGPNYYIYRSFSPLLRLPFRWAVVAPAGLLGIVLSFIKKKPAGIQDARVFLVGYLFFFSISIILIFVMGRLRLPALAILFLFAGYAVSEIGFSLQRVFVGTARRAALGRAILLLFLWFAIGAGLRSRDNTVLIGWNDYFNLGTAYELSDRFEEALEQYEKARLMAPPNNSLSELCASVQKRMDALQMLNNRERD